MIKQTPSSVHLLLLNSQQLYIKWKTLLPRHQVFGCTCFEEKTQWRLAVNQSKFYSNHTLSLIGYTNRSAMKTIFSKLIRDSCSRDDGDDRSNTNLGKL